jgi:hypothetical protein
MCLLLSRRVETQAYCGFCLMLIAQVSIVGLKLSRIEEGSEVGARSDREQEGKSGKPVMYDYIVRQSLMTVLKRDGMSPNRQYILSEICDSFSLLSKALSHDNRVSKAKIETKDGTRHQLQFSYSVQNLVPPSSGVLVHPFLCIIVKEADVPSKDLSIAQSRLDGFVVGSFPRQSSFAST